jgi:PD-(D/E)XK nuclease superfamily/Domain of unknown function (DUF2357)
MASSPISRISFVTSGGDPIAAPLEWQRGLVVLECGLPELELVELRRNDTPLELLARRVNGQLRVVADWPPSDAGYYSLMLSWGDGSRPDDEYACQVLPAKLDQAEVEELVRDLQERLPASLAFALSRRGAFAGVTLVPPGDATLEQELDHLRRAVDGGPGRAGLAALLRSIARQPHQVLETEVHWTTSERARLVHVPGLAHAFGRPGNVDAERRPMMVPERRATHVTDVYENQMVRLYHDLVVRRLRTLTNVRRHDALKNQVQQVLARVSAARRVAAFLDDVTPLASSSSRGSMVLLKRQDYRAVSEGLRDLRRRALIRLDEPKTTAPLSNLPHLYERWVTLEVIVAALQTGNELGYEHDRVTLLRRHGDELLVDLLPGGNRAIVELSHATRGTKVRVFAQRHYTPEGTGLRSISFRQIPDVAIEVEGRSRTEVILFDAKYKLGSEGTANAAADGLPAKADIDAMHTYSDAIRDVADRRVVSLAAILYPGRNMDYGAHLAALRARPGQGEALQSELCRRLEPVFAAA